MLVRTSAVLSTLNTRQGNSSMRSTHVIPCLIENLELRVLFTFAPASIAGFVFSVKVTAGSYPFADIGSYVFRPAASGNKYKVSGDGTNVASSSGTYSYAKTGSTTGEVIANDSRSGGLGGEFILTLQAPAASF